MSAITKNPPIDLSKVENSMTKIIQDNIHKINATTTVSELANLLTNLFEKHNLNTKASNRLLNKVKLARSISSAQKIVLNSFLAGTGNSVIC